ncbi:cathepsin J-like [Planococcus citri]|uniref:cathepsin J-like n=1 Tax=Planococcus citri TaxID=170843 RepID=UPI0031F94970
MGNNGCKGGLAFKACELVKKNKKMPDEDSFKKNCALKKMENTVFLNVINCCTLSMNDHFNNITKNLCEFGPMSAFISAGRPSFQFAKEGIYHEDDCGWPLNHEVLLVGYNGTDKNHSYWIVKNSFGTSWGDNGFLKISTKANKAGCTIIGDVSFPELKPVIAKHFVYLYY